MNWDSLGCFITCSRIPVLRFQSNLLPLRCELVFIFIRKSNPHVSTFDGLSAFTCRHQEVTFTNVTKGPKISEF